MSSYQIQSNDGALPALSLPSGARPVSHPDYEHDVEIDPPEIEPIEHRLRVDFIDGGPVTLHELHGPGQPLARRYADRTLTDTYHAERRYYGTFPDDEQLADAPAFLHAELRVFTDWVQLVFTSLARDDDAYRKHVAGYEADYPDAVQAITADYADAFSDLVIATETTNADVLGRVYERVGGPSDRFGQFFTPPNLARAMARMALFDADDLLRIGDPRCGSGRFLVAAAHELTASAPDKPAIFVGQDLDPLCARMTGINLALHGIPGYAVHGDSLTGEAMAGWRIDHSQPEDGVIHTVDPDRVAFGPNTDIDDTSGSEHGRRRGNGTVDASSNSTTDPVTPRQIDLTDFRF